MTITVHAASAALAADVRRAGWAALLPAHRADGEDRPVGAPACRAVLKLGRGLALVVVADEGGRFYPVPLDTDASPVRRARPGDGAAESLVGLLGQDSRVIGDIEITTWHHRQASGERAITVDQTNESVIVGDQAVVKWTFLAEAGPHPAPSLLAELDRHGFTGMPLPWGAVQWSPAADAAPVLLALVTDFVPRAVDGWTWVVEDLRSAASERDPAVARAAGAAVGGLVASFHLALADTSRPSTETEVSTWRDGALADLERALSASQGRAREVLQHHAAAARAVLDDIPEAGTPIIRVHGDLHVGQVLRSPGADGCPSYTLTDFDGNPVVPASDRVREQPAALDVAGMAQSFVHAGFVVRKHHPDLDADSVIEVSSAARTAFLESYRNGLSDRGDLLDERLLRPFALRQVCREFVYAATHLPRWSYVPEAALPMLLHRADCS